jgi:hypothetical protein
LNDLRNEATSSEMAMAARSSLSGGRGDESDNDDDSHASIWSLQDAQLVQLPPQLWALLLWPGVSTETDMHVWEQAHALAALPAPAHVLKLDKPSGCSYELPYPAFLHAVDVLGEAAAVQAAGLEDPEEERVWRYARACCVADPRMLLMAHATLKVGGFLTHRSGSLSHHHGLTCLQVAAQASQWAA